MEPKQAKTQARELLESAPVAMVSTLGAEGAPQTRAMSNLRNRVDFPGLAEYFGKHGGAFGTLLVTARSSPKVAQIRAHPAAAVFFCRPEAYESLMLGGDLEILDDETVKRGLWQDAWNRFFQGGVADPEYTLLRLQPRVVKYVANAETTMVS